MCDITAMANESAFLMKCVEQAGQLALSFYQRGVSHSAKSMLTDILTAADVAVNELIVDAIELNFPEDGIVSEELAEPINPESPRQWIIDPIDGTWSFAHGVEMWCVPNRLARGRRNFSGCRFRAGDWGPLLCGTGSRRATKWAGNQSQRRRATCQRLCFVCHSPRRYSDLEMYSACVERLLRKGTMLVSFPSMLGACYFARGAVHGYFNNCGYDHDYAGLALLCEEAGAIVTDVDGNPWRPGRRDIVMGAPEIHAELLEELNSTR